MVIGIDEVLSEVGHTRDSLFALLDLALPREELERMNDLMSSTNRAYTMAFERGRYMVLGSTRFTIENHICHYLGIPIGVAEKLAIEYAVARDYAVQVWRRYHLMGGSDGQAKAPDDGD